MNARIPVLVAVLLSTDGIRLNAAIALTRGTFDSNAELSAACFQQNTGDRAQRAPRSRQPSKPRRTARVLRALDIAEGQTVADIGCGNGWLSQAMAAEVGADGKVYAVDIQESALRKVRKREVPNVVPVLSEPDDVKLPTGSLDLAILHDVASHVDKQARPEFYASVARALKPDASLVIFDPHGKARKMLAEIRKYGFIPRKKEDLAALSTEELDARLEKGIRFRYLPPAGARDEGDGS